MYIIECFVANKSLNVNRLYSYCSKENVEHFKRVYVNFGRSKTEALVINSFCVEDIFKYEEEKGFKISSIISVIDAKPIITSGQFELAKWLSRTTFSPLISSLNTMLPKYLRTSKLSSEPVKTEIVRKKPINNITLTAKQKNIYDLLKDGMKASEARKLSLSIFNKLKSLGLIETEYVDKVYSLSADSNTSVFNNLTDEQKRVYEEFLSTNKTVSLLFGITGSGKTEVYLHLARKYLNDNKEILILVPEISLTPQMIQRVKERFQDVVFYHSELSDQERYEQYQRVKNEEVKIVVGTRSSIFLPFHNLGLIIVDEEHDSSYKQDNMPCYNVKDVAIKIAHDNNAKVLLASATPSLDSYTRALKGDYNLLKLENRINNKLPSIEIADLVNECKNNGSYIISKELKNNLTDVLTKNKQAIILLNRRGYSPIIKCSNCGSTLMCNNCDSPLNYHKDENVYKCHICGRTYKMVNTCPKCGQKSLIYYGFGTKKVEEELNIMFPQVRCVRMDHDNVTRKGSHQRILNDFGEHKYDILIGTQMIAKGLDFPDVTLVGILNADAGLAHQDYNSAKNTFDLLMQASGRSGRANEQGKVIIQAFNPDHYVLKSVLSQDYNYFYNIEMNYRYKLQYPPYSHLIEIILSDTNINRLNNSTDKIWKELEKIDVKKYSPIDIGKINSLYRRRIILANKNLNNLIDSIWDIIDKFISETGNSKIKIQIDPNYLN